MKPIDKAEAVADIFNALADKTRLRILNLMREDEICVCFFSEALGESQPKISRHLAYLRKSGLVESRRDGKWMHYSLRLPEDPAVAEVVRGTLDLLWDQDDMREDYRNLERVCCAVDPPVTIARAPKPEVFAEREMGFEEDGEEEIIEDLETYLL